MCPRARVCVFLIFYKRGFPNNKSQKKNQELYDTMESLKNFISFKIEEITKLRDKNGEPSLAQLSQYTHNTADQLMLQIVAHAPSDIQQYCLEGVRQMGWDRQTQTPIQDIAFVVQVIR